MSLEDHGCGLGGRQTIPSRLERAFRDASVGGCGGVREPELTQASGGDSREEILLEKHVEVSSEKPGPSKKVGCAIV